MTNMLTWDRVGCVVLFVAVFSAWPSEARGRFELFEPLRAKPWRAVHLLDYKSDKDLEALGKILAKLADMGINTAILEVNYNFAFKSHPELRRGSDPITREGARRFAATCRKLGIRTCLRLGA